MEKYIWNLTHSLSTEFEIWTDFKFEHLSLWYSSLILIQLALSVALTALEVEQNNEVKATDRGDLS